MTPRLSRTSLAPLALWLAAPLVGCGGSGGDEVPPIFNAVDPSVQCPAGQIGWDFSTGGNDDDVIPQNVLSGVKTLSAIYSCGTSPVDLTRSYGLQCDGKSLCTRTVVTAPDASARSCTTGVLHYRYRCGNETQVYDITTGVLQPTANVTLSCGQPITIISATYPSNKTPAPTGNLSNALSQRCSAGRHCFPGTGKSLYGAQADPLPNVAKQTEVRYFCGSDIQTNIVTFSEDEPIDITCPLDPAPAAEVELMHFEAARPTTLTPWPESNRSMQAFATARLAEIKAACEGKATCTVTIPAGALAYMNSWQDDAPRGTAVSVPWKNRRLEFTYWCGAAHNPVTKTLNLGGSANKNITLTLTCGQNIHIAKAMTKPVVAGSSSSPVDTTAAWIAKCENLRNCYDSDSLPDGGPNPAETDFTYTCGDNNAIQFNAHVKKFNVTPPGNDFQCPQLDPSGHKHGIRITSATSGVDGGTGRMAPGSKNDLIGPVATQCTGADKCTPTLPSGVAGASITYRCGQAPEEFAVAGGVTDRDSSYQPVLMMSCSPKVNVRNIAGCMGGNPGVAPYKDPCPYGIYRGTCDWYPFGGMSPFYPSSPSRRPGCPTGIPMTVTYTCGSDPTVKTVTQEGDTSLGSSWHILISCPALDTPYIDKTCVPKSCSGRTKRDARLSCVDDATKEVTRTYESWPSIAPWLPDGGSGSFAAGSPPLLKEDVPYKATFNGSYGTVSGNQLTAEYQGSLWVYDVFSATDAGAIADAGTVVGFRCSIGEVDFPTMQSGRASQTATFTAGGKGAVLPPTCFRQDFVDDRKTSWNDAASRLSSMSGGQVTEAQFRAHYQLSRTRLASSFDPRGKAARRLTKNGPDSTAFVPNPVGFFYVPSLEWIDQYSYLRQTSSPARDVDVVLQQSTQIELAAVSAALNDAVINIDGQDPSRLPSFGVNFSWYVRGDSPYKNPYSPQKRLTTKPAVSTLADRNLRATIEISKVNSTLPNQWVPLNTVAFPAQALAQGNALLKTERLQATLTPSTRTKALTVSDGSNGGWMSSRLDFQSAFNVRVCLDLDGLSRAPSDTAIDDRYLSSVSVAGQSYTLGISRRCSASAPLVLKRDLFKRPALPVQTTEPTNETGYSNRQGGDVVNTSNDIGVQRSCDKSCAVASDCGTGGTCALVDGGVPSGGAQGVCRFSAATHQECTNQSRADMTVGGQFSHSIFSLTSNGSSSMGGSPGRATSASSAQLLGFTVLDASNGDTSAAEGDDNPGQFELKLSLGRTWASVAAVGELFKQLETKGNPEPIKPWWKPEVSKPWGKEPKPALAVGVSVETLFLAGPVPINLSIEASVGFGFDIELDIIGDVQTKTRQHNPIYPCLGDVKCVKAFTAPKTFLEANEDCQFQGGRLAELVTTTDVAAVRQAIDGGTYAGGDSQSWVGGQLSYLYDDPTCDTAVLNAGATATRASCAARSYTRYYWLTGDVAFADQLGQAPALVGTYTTYGVGSGINALVSQVPNKAAVTFKPASGQLNANVTSEVHPYVCEFLPASSYVLAEIKVTPSVEFSAGVGASACVPSSSIGMCLALEFKFITAGVSVEVDGRAIAVFNNQNLMRSVLGRLTVTGEWEVAFLTGEVNVELNYFFGSDSWTIARYDGVAAWSGELFDPVEKRYRRVLLP